MHRLGDHPNVVRFFGSSVELLYLAFEYVDNGNLQARPGDSRPAF